MREVTMQLYEITELTPKARAVAFRNELECLQPRIRDMIEALFVRELAKVGATLDGLDIDWEARSITASVSTPYDDAKTICITESLIEELTETAQKELGSFMGDAYVQANIEGDALEFLVDGRVWVYGGEEQ